MENPPYPAMTFQQIIRELRKLSDKDQFIEINETQLTKLLQHHATGPIRLKIEGEVRRSWQLVKGKKLDNKEIREALTKCGL
ncbi:hypothetical protein [Candidatus Williamhamiltonella defendens]|nr:hypothetical protein [Candidatus Hamiltonella defensa]